MFYIQIKGNSICAKVLQLASVVYACFRQWYIDS